MRVNEPTTNRQKDYDAAQKIVSTTDAKGVITSINDDFISISGFTEEELIGQAQTLFDTQVCPKWHLKNYGIAIKQRYHGWEWLRIAVKMATITG
jgi:aerotaxis receptor